jgi:hypothetical protein
MTIERNLILVHQPGCQDRADFETIAHKVMEMSPDIEAFIASNEIPSSVTRKKAGRRPTLIFSPGNLIAFRPMRGKIYAGKPIPKLDQMSRLRTAGVPVPAFVEITPGISLPEEVFGSHVVVKPGFPLASHGQDITLMRREAVVYRPREEFPPDHPGRFGPMFAQRFVDTGPFVNHYRVLTLFGAPLLAYRNTSTVTRPSFDAEDEAIARIPLKARRQAGMATTELIQEPDVLAVAQRTYAALPEIPLHGVDVIREAASQKLYILEVNPGGNTWIFSKGEITTRLKKALRIDNLSDQFDAFTTAATVLIERTRAEAE